MCIGQFNEGAVLSCDSSLHCFREKTGIFRCRLGLCFFLNALFKTTYWNHCVLGLATEEWNPSVPRRGSVKKMTSPVGVNQHCLWQNQAIFKPLQAPVPALTSQPSETHSFLLLEHSDGRVKEIRWFSSGIKGLCLSFYPGDYLVAVLQKPDVRIWYRSVLLWEWQPGICSQDSFP